MDDTDDLINFVYKDSEKKNKKKQNDSFELNLGSDDDNR